MGRTDNSSLRRFSALLMLCGTLLITSCASKDLYEYSEVSDPFESSNRAVFAFNEVLDENFAEPVARGYRAVMPEPARKGVRNVLTNLATPVNAGNQLLQGDVDGVVTDLGRALINTTIGIAGLFDVAGYLGLEHEPEDFGQTLGVWGFAEGPYFVIPLLGPSNMRDSVGRLTDSFADPLNIYLMNIEEEELIYTRWGVSLLSQREGLLDVLDELKAGSIDYYAVMRSSYTQYRRGLIRDDAGGSSYVAIPDFDEE